VKKRSEFFHSFFGPSEAELVAAAAATAAATAGSYYRQPGQVGGPGPAADTPHTRSVANGSNALVLRRLKFCGGHDTPWASDMPLPGAAFVLSWCR
jgi:hypothetical protein